MRIAIRATAIWLHIQSTSYNTQTGCLYELFRLKRQNFSQKICFTAAKHSGAKNGRFGTFPNPRPRENQGAEGENLPTAPAFVHVFRSNFAPFRVSVSTPNFQKSTPNFQKALTFFSQRSPFFAKIKPIH